MHALGINFVVVHPASVPMSMLRLREVNTA